MELLLPQILRPAQRLAATQLWMQCCRHNEMMGAHFHVRLLCANCSYQPASCLSRTSGTFSADFKDMQQEAVGDAAMCNSSSVAFVCTTSDGTIMRFNSAAETMFGYSRKEAVGQEDSRVIP